MTAAARVFERGEHSYHRHGSNLGRRDEVSLLLRRLH